MHVVSVFRSIFYSIWFRLFKTVRLWVSRLAAVVAIHLYLCTVRDDVDRFVNNKISNWYKFNLHVKNPLNFACMFCFEPQSHIHAAHRIQNIGFMVTLFSTNSTIIAIAMATQQKNTKNISVYFPWTKLWNNLHCRKQPSLRKGNGAAAILREMGWKETNQQSDSNSNNNNKRKQWKGIILSIIRLPWSGVKLYISYQR